MLDKNNMIRLFFASIIDTISKKLLTMKLIYCFNTGPEHINGNTGSLNEMFNEVLMSEN